jgi:uncharacterized membrane protein (UPF0127 family)
MSPHWRMVRQDTGEVVVEQLAIAAGLWSRLIGLQFRASLPAGQGLFLVPCSSVHTFFVRFPIDIVFLDWHGQVLAVRAAVKPWRLAHAPEGTRAVLEVPGGTATLRPGITLRLQRGPGNKLPVPAAARYYL